MFVRRPRGTTAAARRSGAQPGTDDQRPQEGNQHPATQFFTGWMPFCHPTNSIKALKTILTFIKAEYSCSTLSA